MMLVAVSLSHHIQDLLVVCASPKAFEFFDSLFLALQREMQMILSKLMVRKRSQDLMDLNYPTQQISCLLLLDQGFCSASMQCFLKLIFAFCIIICVLVTDSQPL